ncbi:MAG: saccharopine dehydrogenase NADP-binding domain-containing protein [Proteobacteria bacterium]|nr:saccharopine dehydrogenase NADP-binding domain-containing protein [Pseudomonadota bacterium]
MNNHQTSVLLVGATGVFGRLLARQLMCERGIHVVLAGRTRSSLETLRDELGDGPCGTKGCQADVAVLDRNVVTDEELRKTGAAVVIDAAGPFQDSRTTLIEAAIEAGYHYIDLADGRDFVTGITRFDAGAKAKGVAVIAGASTSPALINAVADDLTRGWQRIDTLRVALSLGSRAPRGLSVVQAALSYAGQTIQVFREGRWTTARGWGGTRKVTFPGLGDRLVSLCDTPDLDLLAVRFKPRVAVEFLGGLEQPSLQRTLIAAS